MGGYTTINPTASSGITGSGTAGQIPVFGSSNSVRDPGVAVTVGTSGIVIGSTAEVTPSAILTLTSTTQGFLPPRMTSAQRNAIATPIPGMLVYNSTSDSISLYTSGGGVAAWEGLISTAQMPANYAVGDILYASTTSTLSRLAAVATGSVLVSAGLNTAPAWSTSPTLTTSLTVPLIQGSGGALNLGTNAVATIVTIGNVTGATSVNINSGTASNTWTTTNATWTLNTGTGAINIGTDATAKGITIGSSTSGTSILINSAGDITFNSNNGNVNLNSGTGSIDIGTDAVAHTITIGGSTGVSATSVRNGTGALSIGTNSVAQTITIGNITGATRTLINTGTAGSTWTTTNGSWTVNTGTANFNINADATINIINIGTGAATKTVNIGSSSACLIGWFSAAITRPTTGGAAATFVANTSGIANNTATWDSYTWGTVVKALRNFKLLA